VIRYVTPAFILVVFVGALVQPVGGNWGAAMWSLFDGGDWPYAAESVIGRIAHIGDTPGWLDADGNVTRVMVQDVARLVLLLVFAGLVLLVRQAWKRKERRRP